MQYPSINKRSDGIYRVTDK